MACFMLTSVPVVAGDADAQEQAAINAAVDRVAPAVVRIETIGGLERVGKTLIGAGPSTGLVVDPAGYIISSEFSFVNRPASILVRLSDGVRKPAKLVATDHSRMIVLLKINAERPMPVCEIAPRKKMRVGQWAIAVGRTFDNDQPNRAVGILSALDRVWGKAIQTDAAVSPNNYGGPLIDISGRVMGVLAPLSPEAADEMAGIEWYDSGIGFAIPAADLMQALPRLQAGENLKPGLMGVSFTGNDLSGEQPVVERVRFQSPAAVAGVAADDVIVSADDIAIARLGNLKHVLGRKYAGETLRLKLLRKSEPLELSLKLVAEIPPWDEATAGFLLSRPALTADVPASDSKSDLSVRAVFPNSPAAKADLRRSDVIVSVDGQSIETPQALRLAFDRLKPGDKVKLGVLRSDANGALQEATVEITLMGQPFAIPSELASVTIDSPIAAEDGGLVDGAASAKAKGRFVDKLPVNGREYWGYAPASTLGKTPHGLIVWLHPNGNSMEAAVLKSLKAECNRRQLVLVGPKAEGQGWTPEDVDFVKALVEHLRTELPIDPSRVVVMGHTDSTKLASFVAFKDPALYRGVILIGGATAGMPPERDPSARTHLHLSIPDGSRAADSLKKLVEALTKQKFAVTSRSIAGDGSEFPSGEWAEEVGIWLDQLDRF
jgi:serine protease Do